MKSFQNIDDYIANFPEDVQEVLEQIRATIQKAAPQAEEAISYQMPTFKLNGNLVHFAAWKNHIGFYPTPSAVKAFGKDLARFRISDAAIQFPLQDPLPLDLVRKITVFRVRESLKEDKKWRT